MSDDSSSDEGFPKDSELQMDFPPEKNCRECGKVFNKFTNLQIHYRRHKLDATCNICKITFSRFAALFRHLNNVHLGSSCFRCRQYFSDVWELNKHSSTECTQSSLIQNGSLLGDKKSCDFSVQSTDIVMETVDMNHQKPEGDEFSVEYIVGKDYELENCSEKDDPSSSSDTDDGTLSQSSSKTSDSEDNPAPITRRNESMCDKCGRGPFRSLKLHLFHCTGSKKTTCVLCETNFATEKALQEHHIPLYLCKTCGQVLPNKTTYNLHPCPKSDKATLVLFCSEVLPKVCNLCKSFFSSDRALSIHVTKVHSSVVSTKVCVITNPSLLAQKDLTSLTVSPSASSLPGTPTPTKCAKSAVVPLNQPANEPQQPPAAPETGHSNSPSILALFVNRSQEAALMERMSVGWRSKAARPCRQCGAILRQPSLIISHRYRHAGRRTHACQCGRTFKHQMHLLRHCVQHAEALSYICASCGDTFSGATLLTRHLTGEGHHKSSCGRKMKNKAKTKCRMSFVCDCGQMFMRPSAYIWHQLKNGRPKKSVKNGKQTQKNQVF